MPPENPFIVDPRVDCPTPKQDNPDVAKPDESFVAPSVTPGLQELIPGVRERLPFSDKGYPKYGPGRGKAEFREDLTDVLNLNPNDQIF